MKIKTLKFGLYFLALVTVFVSCEKDDDDSTIIIQEEDRTEQQIKDDSTLVDYLEHHYFNSSFFESGSNHKYSDIIVTKLPQDDEGNYLDMPDPDQNTLLIDVVETYETEFLETDYKYYVLRLNQGEGDAPNFSDEVRVRYEGSSVVNENVFDSRITPEDLPMVGNGFTTFGTIRAWQLVMPTFNSALDFSINNGIVNYNNFGLGIMFVPSGLAYFSGTNTGASYDNLIFKFELLQYEQIDHDSDGVPTYLEDLDGDLDVINDDTDEDNFPNYIDLDDDGDDVLTFDELISKTYTEDDDMIPFMSEADAQDYFDTNAASNEMLVSIDINSNDSTYELKTIIIADSNDDGTPDYLDENITINYNEE